MLNLYWESILQLQRDCFVLLVIIESDMSLPLADFSMLPLLPIATGLHADPDGW